MEGLTLAHKAVFVVLLYQVVEPITPGLYVGEISPGIFENPDEALVVEDSQLYEYDPPPPVGRLPFKIGEALPIQILSPDPAKLLVIAGITVTAIVSE